MKTTKRHKHYSADGRFHFVSSLKLSNKTVWNLYDDSGDTAVKVGTFSSHNAAAAHIGSTGKINDYPTYA